MAITQIADYEKQSFSAVMHNGYEAMHDVYTRGKGRPVVLIQELPGIGQETLRLADKLIEAGFSVVMPHLFGPIGRTSLVGNIARVFCLRREFKLFEANKSSPIVDWLKALCTKVATERSVEGVGVIGMCLTGNFAISLIAHDNVLAAVASQPSMPVFKHDALHMSKEEVLKVCKKIDETQAMLMLRFEKDVICRSRKEKVIDETFNADGKNRIKKHIMPGKRHSVLTIDFVDQEGHPTYQALESVISYFDQQLDK